MNLLDDVIKKADEEQKKSFVEQGTIEVCLYLCLYLLNQHFPAVTAVGQYMLRVVLLLFETVLEFVYLNR